MRLAWSVASRQGFYKRPSTRAARRGRPAVAGRDACTTGRVRACRRAGGGGAWICGGVGVAAFRKETHCRRPACYPLGDPARRRAWKDARKGLSPDPAPPHVESVPFYGDLSPLNDYADGNAFFF